MPTRRAPSQYNWLKAEFDEHIVAANRRSARREKVQFVVAHHMTIPGTGNGDALDACFRTWLTREASAHYGIDGDYVAQFVYDNEAAWATANTHGNHAGISIEHANLSLGPKWTISVKTFLNGARLAAILHVIHKLGRPTSSGFGTGGTLRTHQSFYATSCPGPYFKGKWDDYVREAQVQYDIITKGTPVPIPTPSTPTKVSKWGDYAFLNLHGDDGGEGERTFKDRTPKMVADLTRWEPDIVGVCELTTKQQPGFSKAMLGAGYEKIAYSHRLGLYTLPSVTVGPGDFYEYPKQNAGAVEGILRQRLNMKGSWLHVGVTHLDYRDGFDAGRVTQMNQGIDAMESFGERWEPEQWLKRTAIAGDFNSEDWVWDKAFKPNKFKAGVRDHIDGIAVGNGRATMKNGKRITASDHPVVWVRLGKTV